MSARYSNIFDTWLILIKMDARCAIGSTKGGGRGRSSVDMGRSLEQPSQKGLNLN